MPASGYCIALISKGHKKCLRDAGNKELGKLEKKVAILFLELIGSHSNALKIYKDSSRKLLFTVKTKLKKLK